IAGYAVSRYGCAVTHRADCRLVTVSDGGSSAVNIARGASPAKPKVQAAPNGVGPGIWGSPRSLLHYHTANLCHVPLAAAINLSAPGSVESLQFFISRTDRFCDLGEIRVREEMRVFEDKPQ